MTNVYIIILHRESYHSFRHNDTKIHIYTGETDTPIPHDATHVHVVAIIKVIFHDGHSMHVKWGHSNTLLAFETGDFMRGVKIIVENFGFLTIVTP